jgi:cytoplasmic iron level regulating protein YaaA (DUF328/UPF0246 family)
MSYLITCCKSKQTPLIKKKGKLENLFEHEKLGNHRKKLIELSGIKLDWNKTLPAYELYSGQYSKIYRKISTENWNKKGADILILSALFGWIKHTDLIPFYDLKITEIKGKLKNAAYIYWRDNANLSEFIDQNDIDLLSTTYNKALDSNPAQVPQNFQFTDRGDCVGYWLEKELSNLNTK